MFKFKNIFFVIILFTISLSIPNISFAVWTQQTDIGILRLRNYTYSPDGTSLISSANNGYPYISTDNGATWTQQTSVGALSLVYYTYSPDGTYLIATSNNDSYTYISTDNGATWTQQTSVGAIYLYDYTYSPDGTYLIATSDNDTYIYTSTDNGATWTQQTSVGAIYLYDYTYSPDGTSLIATSNNDSYTYISTDNGATWTQQTSVGALVLNDYTYSSDGTYLIATSGFDGYVYISINENPFIFENGSGIEGDPYQISTCLELQNINYVLSDGVTYPYLSESYYFKMMNDIDCSDTLNWNSGTGFESVGNATNKFIGNFDGDGYIVSDLYINRSAEDNIGLFGYIENSVIENVGLEDINITGYSYVGGLVGYSNYSHIENTYTTGSVTDTSSRSYVGGLVGSLNGSLFSIGTIVNSYSTCSVSGSSSVGGLVGIDNGDRIYNSFATGNVSLFDYVGGVVGRLFFDSEYTIDDVIFNSGWYESVDNLEFNDIKNINGVVTLDNQLSHHETELSSFYSSSHPIYNGTVYPWVYSGSPWIFHNNSLPDFNEGDEETEEEIPTRSIRSSGSSASTRYKNLLAMGNENEANKILEQFPNQINQNNNQLDKPVLNLIRTLRYGMSGDDVKELQKYLNTHGYESGLVDGKFGPKTRQAVIKFQIANSLVGDGIIGPLTRAKLK
ncbi:TPA: hypothetical protein DIC38_01290 [Candidatus Nomurabacteria bacterium]|nr:hypothetical protein [Candidatus Nomurabacteria bacterium]